MAWIFFLVSVKKKKKKWDSRPFSSILQPLSSAGTNALAHICLSFLGTARREKQKRHGETGVGRGKYLNTSATSKALCTALIPKINQIMEQMDLKDDTTKKWAQWLEQTPLHLLLNLSWAKQGLISEQRPGIGWVPHPRTACWWHCVLGG
jgi:hypothetical protein